MKGKGPKYERETIINFNEESEMASIWTASEVVYRRLMKLGYIFKLLACRSSNTTKQRKI
jgi:hypothetical protein